MIPLRRVIRDTKASVAIIFALALIPLLFLVGMGIDYTVASDRQTQLNGFADAAALAAVTPAMMAQSDATAAAAAQNAFNAQANTISGIQNLTVSASASTVQGGVRTAVVSYTATSPTFFSRILGTPGINLSGSATAKAGIPPNIDFYLLLDDSPSMAIGATPSDISTLVSLTANYPSAYQSCGFGCHEQNPTTGHPTGCPVLQPCQDLYQLARNNNVTLRIDLLRQATQNLMDTAQNTENNTKAQYRMGIYTFDVGFNKIQDPVTSDLSAAKTAAGNISLLEVYQNNWLTSTNQNNDTDTNFDNAFSSINKIMPDPGSGTNANNDTPQEVLFLVTDGVEDENVNGSRQQSLINTQLCTTIKNRGIRIAVLYTVYQPLPTNSWYNTYIASFQPQIGPTLQSCASPGLYFAVQSGGDISAALSTLFELAVQSAYLAK